MLCVCRYTKEFFPPNYLLTQYLKDFVEYYNLNIQYNTKISDITPPNAAVPGSVFGMRDQHGNTYNCKWEPTVFIYTYGAYRYDAYRYGAYSYINGAVWFIWTNTCFVLVLDIKIETNFEKIFVFSDIFR